MLITLLFLCLFSAISLLFVDLKYIRSLSFYSTLLLFLYSLNLLFFFDPFLSSYQYQFYITWGDFFNIYYSIGIDGLSLFFVLLTTFLMPFCLLLSWVNVSYRLREFAVCMLIIEFFLINVFTVLDFFFFIFFLRVF